MRAKGFVARFLASVLVLGCVAYGTALFRWTSWPCPDAAYNVDRLRQQEALAWLLGVNVLALLFVFTRSTWVPVALAVLGVVGFTLTFPILAFTWSDECGVEGWGLVLWVFPCFGGSMLMVAAAVSLVVKVVRYFAGRTFGRSGLTVGGSHFRLAGLAAALALVAAAGGTLLILTIGLDWGVGLPFDFWAWAFVVVPAAALVATCVAGSVALWRAVTRRHR
jgi:hypothetical protein